MPDPVDHPMPTPHPPLDEEQHALWAAEAISELRQILYWRWDPIGVSDQFPSNADEYDAYTEALMRRMRHGADARQIARYLATAERFHMGLAGRSEDDLLTVARLIEAWFSNSLWCWRGRTSTD